MCFKNTLQTSAALEHTISEGKILGSSAIPEENKSSIKFKDGGKFEGTEKEIKI
jgi:hypothetical protein